MSDEQIFQICNTLALLAWVLLWFAPKWKWTHRLVRSMSVVLLLAAIYVLLLVSSFGMGEGGFDSLQNVVLLFQDPRAVLTGWIHYLAFDLFVGLWIVQDAEQEGINHWYTLPALVLAFLLGPAGLLLYFLMRTAKRKFGGAPGPATG